jgi:ubiquinone/menaquinone biosynthesis C-methylase UbiE
VTASHSLESRIQERFGRAAAAYAVSPVHRGGADLDAMRDAAELTGRERLLDLGCGPGHAAATFAPLAAEVVGLDLTEAMIAQARRLASERGLANLRFEHGDAAALPFPDRSFERVTSRLSAHHYADPGAVLREVARVLAPGGAFLLVDVAAPEDPTQDSFLQAFEMLRDPSHVRDHSVSQWNALFRAAGLEPELLGRFTIHQEFQQWVERMDTSPGGVVGLRALCDEAPAEVRGAFGIRGHGHYDFDLELVLMRGRAR